VSELSADEAFALSEHYCGRGHPKRSMAETAVDPVDPWTRRFECPVCDFSFWETLALDGDGSRSSHYRSE
jgi:hypothetical protein